MKRILSALALGLAACSVAPIESSWSDVQGDKGAVAFTVEPAHEVSEGADQFTMKLSDVRTGAPVSGANATLRTLMPAMGHQSDEATVEETTAGTYVLSGILFDMPGTWALRVHVVTDSLSDNAEFELEVP